MDRVYFDWIVLMADIELFDGAAQLPSAGQTPIMIGTVKRRAADCLGGPSDAVEVNRVGRLSSYASGEMHTCVGA